MAAYTNYVSVFAQTGIFANSDEAEIGHFLAASQSVTLAPDELLFRQGDAAQSLFLIADGTLRVTYQPTLEAEETVIDQLGPGDIVGEMALLTHSPRSASVRAVTTATLFEINKESFFEHQTSCPRTFSNLTALFEERLQREQLADTLHAIFPQLDFSLIHELQQRMRWRLLRGGETLFKQGDVGSSIYFVVNGRLQITRTRRNGTERFLTEVQRGDIIGEFAFFSDEPRSATIAAVRDAQVVELTKEDFDRLVEQYPHTLMEMTRLIVRRVQATNKNDGRQHGKTLKTIAFVPLHPSLPIDDIMTALAHSFAKLGDTKLLDSTRFSDEFGLPDAANISESSPFNPMVLAWLSDQERQNQYLLYQAEITSSSWTWRCLRQADRIVLLADASADPTPTQLEQDLAESQVFARRELLMVHPETADSPQKTARWLAPRQIHTHYHVRQNEPGHYERAARRMAGCAICLVYSGGGARGFAHLGVWRALEELDVPVDYIGGTSMGAILAATNSIGWNFDTIASLAQSLSNPRTLFDYTLPFTSLMASHKLTRFCQKLFGDRRIEDLWVPYFCIATNATTAEADVIQSGPVWKAVRKSIAIPGVFTPVMEDGDLIIDGGIMNNFPVDVIQHLAESNTVIGVNVSPYREKKRTYTFDTNISGWAIMWSRINPFGQRLRAPSLVGTILRSLELNSVSLSKRQAIEHGVLLEPDVKAVGLLDFADYETAVKIGYSAALEPLKSWWSTSQTLLKNEAL